MSGANRVAICEMRRASPASPDTLTRPVAKLHVLPGERDAYQEVAGGTGQVTGSGPAEVP